MVSNLVRILASFAREHGLGLVLPSPIDVLFGEGDYFEPDVVFVRADHAHLVGDRGVECPPDLVIEIVSPSTADRDRGIKLERYRHFGVREYWIVDLEARTIEVWRLAQRATAADVMHDGEMLVWSPAADGPKLDVSVAEILP